MPKKLAHALKNGRSETDRTIELLQFWGKIEPKQNCLNNLNLTSFPTQWMPKFLLWLLIPAQKNYKKS